MELLRILKEKMLLKMPKSGDYPLGFGGCGIHRRDEPNVAENCFYRPLATLVVNGRKYSTVGGTKFFLKEGDVLISVVDMPAQNYVVEANSKNPFLSIDLDLDKHIILQILSENPSLVSYADKDVTGVGAYKADEDLLDLFLRIYKLSEAPDKVVYLSSLLLKEMHLRLILSPLGRYICRINAPGGNNFSKAINYIRNNYKKIIEIGELAKIAGLSQSAFHRNFKRITGMSPLQYQKYLRFYEAQRLMSIGNETVENIAFEVGYGSTSQFFREYKKAFGDPPKKSIAKNF